MLYSDRWWMGKYPFLSPSEQIYMWATWSSFANQSTAKETVSSTDRPRLLMQGNQIKGPGAAGVTASEDSEVEGKVVVRPPRDSLKAP